MIHVQEIARKKKALKEFVDFPWELYQNDPTGFRSAGNRPGPCWGRTIPFWPTDRTLSSLPMRKAVAAGESPAGL